MEPLWEFLLNASPAVATVTAVLVLLERMKRLDAIVERVEKRVEKIEQDVDDMNRKLTELATSFAYMKGRINERCER